MSEVSKDASIAGYTRLEARSLDAAVTIVQSHPFMTRGGSLQASELDLDNEISEDARVFVALIEDGTLPRDREVETGLLTSLAKFRNVFSVQSRARDGARWP